MSETIQIQFSSQLFAVTQIKNVLLLLFFLLHSFSQLSINCPIVLLSVSKLNLPVNSFSVQLHSKLVVVLWFVASNKEIPALVVVVVD